MKRVVVVVAALAAVFASAAPAANELQIKILSNRADLISGGDALVEVVLPAGVAASGIHVDVDGADVSSSFAVRDDGRFVGRVEGLDVGANVLTAKKPDGTGARITITNHPIGGPVISGPQVKPWLCTTDAQGLGPPQDDQCNAPTRYAFFYKSTDGSFKTFDPAAPMPADVASTTTDQGKTVKYIVRQETGTQNRGIYRIAVLFDPTLAYPAVTPEPWPLPPAWNHKLLYPFGASCGTVHSQSSAQSVQNDMALSRGFMVATSSMNVLGNNCNTLTSAESVLMLKERIVERYGSIRYTFANGCSGGSIGQHMVSNSFPGLLQGIQPNCSYDDNYTTGNEVQDCHLLVHYYSTVSPQFGASEQTAVNGHKDPSPCVSWEALFAPVDDPHQGCFSSAIGGGSPTPEDYNETTNPTGCRGALRDYDIAVWGKRPQTMWGLPGSPEHLYGGFAKWNYDNVGIQYGLRALQNGQITTAQFADLNSKIGGMDIDWHFVPERHPADPGTESILYRTGRVNDATQLDKVAIIDLRASSNTGDIHTDFHSYSLRQRLIKANGNADNQVIWTFPATAPLVGISPSANLALQAFLLMDRWLAAVEADTTNDPLEVKVARDKPTDAVDRCFGPNDVEIMDPFVCRAAFPYYAAPRIAAGGPFSHDVNKCQLKPLSRTDPDYQTLTVPFTNAEWASLQAAFPSGVCDYSQPAADRQPSVPWLTYESGPGGEPLPPEPVSQPITPTAVVVADASARRVSTGVLLRWRTGDARVLGFDLYRGPRRLAALRGHRSYRWLDRGAPRGALRYRLVATLVDGTRIQAGTIALR